MERFYFTMTERVPLAICAICFTIAPIAGWYLGGQ